MTDRIDEDIVPIELEDDAYWAEIARLEGEAEDNAIDEGWCECPDCGGYYDFPPYDDGLPPYDDTEDNLRGDNQQPYVRRLWDAVHPDDGDGSDTTDDQ